ncbi:hypothetical protein RJT34_29684 [Clitoria ternatea]|uniref:Uncharacterized protein n=1 Tax=Clitoria ternatea TaxID=43366 RepID=A0AAN9ER21_CLITE
MDTICASPEFEFWMLRNPSFPQPNILSADELFHDGVLLPLHLLNKPHPTQIPNPEPSPPITSKRWKDIFRKSEKEKGKKKERKTGNGASAELNINIWPFSRSRSAGNTAGDSKSRKWPNSPGRGGVHLGRSSPVWQIRRSKGAKTKVLNLNVPKCIGYTENSANANANVAGKLFTLRTLFAKKTVVTSH